MSTVNGLGNSASAWSQLSSARTARPTGGPDPAAFKDKLFAKVDANSSGGVDASELQKLLSELSQKTGQNLGSSDAQAALTKKDSNGDGSLGKDELAAGLKSLLPPPGHTVAFAQQRSAKSGTASPTTSSTTASTTNGALSRDEALFKKLDSNADGTIDALVSLTGSDSQSRQDGRGSRCCATRRRPSVPTGPTEDARGMRWCFARRARCTSICTRRGGADWPRSSMSW